MERRRAIWAAGLRLSMAVALSLAAHMRPAA